MSKRFVKLSFTALLAFSLAFGILVVTPSAANVIPNLEALNASLNPVGIGPESNLYKYLHHVPYTQYEWAHPYFNASTCSSTRAPAVTTDHLLWKKLIGSPDWYDDPVAISHKYIGIFDGKVFCTTCKTDRELMIYALDQNTGEIIYQTKWGGGGYYDDYFKLDSERFLLVKKVYNIDTGTFLYTTPRQLLIYSPELMVGISAGPSKGPTGRLRTYLGWDFSDASKPPVQIWQTNPDEMPIQEHMRPTYGNGKWFVCDNFWLYGLDMSTGELLWTTRTRGSTCLCSYQEMSYAYDRVYFGAYYNGGIFSYDANTGQELFWFEGTGSMARNTVIDHGVIIFQEMGSYFWGVDAYDGHPIWKHITHHKIPFHANPSAPYDLGPEEHSKTSIHV